MGESDNNSLYKVSTANNTNTVKNLELDSNASQNNDTNKHNNNNIYNNNINNSNMVKAKSESTNIPIMWKMRQGKLLFIIY